MKLLAGAALLAFVAVGSGQARDVIETDTGLICETQQEAERFVALFDSDNVSVEAAIDAVNAESNRPDACVLATTDFRRVGSVATVRNGEASFDVTRITVVGVHTLNGLERSAPSDFFTLTPRDEGSRTVGQR